MQRLEENSNDIQISGLKFILNLNKVSQDDIAKELNVTKQSVNLWTKLGNSIPKKRLSYLLNKFNVPENFFTEPLILEVKYKGINAIDYIKHKGFKKIGLNKECLKCGYIINPQCKNAYENNWCPSCGFNHK